MNIGKLLVFPAVAGALLFAGLGGAATHPLILTTVVADSPNGEATAELIADGGGWIFDDVAQTVSAGGLYSARYFAGITELFRHDISGYVIDVSGSGTASAASYVCIEGPFGGIVGGNLCGNYSFGGNFVDESEVSWGPGTATFKSMNTTGGVPNGGDDIDIGRIQSIAQNDGFAVQSWDGQTLIISNVVPMTSGYAYTFVTAAAAAAFDDFYAVQQGASSISLDIGANDLGWSPYASVIDDVSGTGTGIGSQGGTFVIVGSGAVDSPGSVVASYTAPTPGFVGLETWAYRVTDTTGPLVGQTDTATVTVTVSSPVKANDDFGMTTIGQPVTINVGANDVGFTSAAAVFVTSGPTQGTTTVNGSPGNPSAISITYVPTAPNSSAPYTDTFTYSIADSFFSDSATVTVDVSLGQVEIPAVANYTINPGSSQSNVGNTCIGAIPGATGEDCSYNAADLWSTSAWVGPLRSSGYYANGTSPFQSDPFAVPLPQPPVPDPTNVSLAVTGSLIIDTLGNGQCNGDDVIAGRFELAAGTRTFFGGPGTWAEETWGDNTIAYVLPESVPDYQNSIAEGCEYIFGSQGFPSLLETRGLSAAGPQIYPVDLVIGSEPINPFEGEQDAWTGPEPGGIGIGSFEGPNFMGNFGVTMSLDSAVFSNGTYSCLDNFGDPANPPVQGPEQCVNPAAEFTPCDETGANFCGQRRDLENVIMRIVVGSSGDIVEARMFANNETIVFNVPPAPERNNSWDGPVIGFTASCDNCGPPDLTDSDEDGVRDVDDNCTLAPNGPAIPDAGGNIQLDTDGDGFGNLCDGDLNNDNRTNSLDLGLFKAIFFTDDADGDYNGDGFVNSLDLGLFKQMFGKPPGPAGALQGGAQQ